MRDQIKDSDQKSFAQAFVGFSINPEITWKTIRVEGERVVAEPKISLAGTSCNVALALKNCGIEPFLLGAVGPDSGQDKILNGIIRSLLENLNILNFLYNIREATPLADIIPERKLRLSYKKPILDARQCVERISALLEHFQPTFTIATGVGNSDADVQLAQSLLSKGTRVLIPSFVLLQHPGKFEALLRHTDILVMNKFEAMEYFKISEFELNHRHLERFLDFGLQKIVVTLGADGAIAVTKSREQLRINAHKVRVVDECGAGDCFTGFMLGALYRGYDFKISLEIANQAGAIKATRRGATNIPSWDEVLNF